MRQQKKWPKIGFGDFCAVAGAAIGGWQALLEDNYGYGLTNAALGLAPAVYNAFRGSRLQLADQPLAYAASVELAFR